MDRFQEPLNFNSIEYCVGILLGWALGMRKSASDAEDYVPMKPIAMLAFAKDLERMATFLAEVAGLILIDDDSDT